MALVRISKQLLADVRKQIDNLSCTERYDIPQVAHDFLGAAGVDPGALTAAEQALWGEHLHLRPQLPSAWVTSVGVAEFFTTHVHPDGHREITQRICCLTPGLVAPPGVRVDFRYTSNAERLSSTGVPLAFEVVQAAANDPDSPMHLLATRIMAVVNYEQTTRAIAKRWAGLQEQLVLFLSKCKSLNEALKLWPNVQMYIPQDYLSAVGAPVVRSQVVRRKEAVLEAVLEAVDTDELTAAAVAARLQGLL